MTSFMISVVPPKMLEAFVSPSGAPEPRHMIDGPLPQRGVVAVRAHAVRPRRLQNAVGRSPSICREIPTRRRCVVSQPLLRAG